MHFTKLEQGLLLKLKCFPFILPLQRRSDRKQKDSLRSPRGCTGSWRRWDSSGASCWYNPRCRCLYGPVYPLCPQTATLFKAEAGGADEFTNPWVCWRSFQPTQNNKQVAIKVGEKQLVCWFVEMGMPFEVGVNKQKNQQWYHKNTWKQLIKVQSMNWWKVDGALKFNVYNQPFILMKIFLHLEFFQITNSNFGVFHGVSYINYPCVEMKECVSFQHNVICL